MILASRVLVVFASAFLVASVGLATLTPRGITLNQGIALADPAAAAWLHARLGTAMQESFLDRPIWFLPAGFGLIFAGLAATLSFSGASESHRRRS